MRLALKLLLLQSAVRPVEGSSYLLETDAVIDNPRVTPTAAERSRNDRFLFPKIELLLGSQRYDTGARLRLFHNRTTQLEIHLNNSDR